MSPNATQTTTPACSAQQKPPAGKPGNFDTNERLKDFRIMGSLVAAMPPVSSTLSRAYTMASMFSPNAIYDIKTNPQFGGTAQGNSALAPFGNYFYGAAAAQMGYTLTETLAAGAVVQQWTNFLDTDPRKRSSSALAQAIFIAITTGQGDNPDDAAPITGGYTYSAEIYNNDSSRDNHENSCNATVTAPISGGFKGGAAGEGFGGGWGSAFTTSVPTGACYGDCNPLRNGTVTVIQR